MSDLIELLRARLAKEEAGARAAGGTSWRYERLADGSAGEPGGYSLTTTDDNVIVDVGFLDDDVLSPAEAEHIARHDPARVLAGVEARRRIIDEYVDRRSILDDQPFPDHLNVGVVEGLEIAVRMLALPYADHPDYQEAWRP